MRHWVARITVLLVLAGATIGLGVAIGAGPFCIAERYCLFLPVLRQTDPSSNPTSTTPMATLPPGSTATIPIGPTIMPVSKLGGVAIIGDSTQDEYQADNPRGAEYNATTFNWVELLVRYRNIDAGPWGTHAEPRRSGYEYNWARSGATTDDMIATGQHTGVAEQVRQGKISNVLIQIGINDFYYSGILVKIYDGTISPAEQQTWIDGRVANIRQAIRTVKSAGNARVLLAATQDYVTHNIVPEMLINAPDPVGRQRIVDAHAQLNQRLMQIAVEEGATFFDFNAAFKNKLNQLVTPNNVLVIGGEQIDLNTRGNEPHHGLLDDAYVHPGTVLAAVMANTYIEELNAVYGTTMPLFSDDEILRIAGIRTTP